MFPITSFYSDLFLSLSFCLSGSILMTITNLWACNKVNQMLPDGFSQKRIHPNSGFVQEQKWGLVYQSSPQRHPSLLSSRHWTNQEPTVGRQVQKAHQELGSVFDLSPRHTRQCAKVQERLLQCHVVVQGYFLRHETHFGTSYTPCFGIIHLEFGEWSLVKLHYVIFAWELLVVPSQATFPTQPFSCAYEWRTISPQA